MNLAHLLSLCRSVRLLVSSSQCQSFLKMYNTSLASVCLKGNSTPLKNTDKQPKLQLLACLFRSCRNNFQLSDMQIFFSSLQSLSKPLQLYSMILLLFRDNNQRSYRFFLFNQINLFSICGVVHKYVSNSVQNVQKLCWISLQNLYSPNQNSLQKMQQIFEVFSDVKTRLSVSSLFIRSSLIVVTYDLSLKYSRCNRGGRGGISNWQGLRWAAQMYAHKSHRC